MNRYPSRIGVVLASRAVLLVVSLALVTTTAPAERVVENAAREAGVPGAPGTYHSDLAIDPAIVRAGQPVRLSFQAYAPSGKTIRFLEVVHERPLHLLIVSEDLAEFEHIHPEQRAGTTYDVTHVFPHGGRYRLYANYTPPGAPTLVEQFDVEVTGAARTRERLVPDSERTKVVDGLKVTLTSDAPLRAGTDLRLRFSVADAVHGTPVTDLELYLGALAHIVVIHEDLGSFVHVHPLEDHPEPTAKQRLGPSPSEVRAVAGFPRPGVYKMWIQLQRKGRIITVPFVVKVGAAPAVARKAPVIPADAIEVRVGSGGYDPPRIDAEQGKPVKLAFLRQNADNCGQTVRFPDLGREYDLPVGKPVIVELTPAKTGEMAFTCGMGMYKGMLLVK